MEELLFDGILFTVDNKLVFCEQILVVAFLKPPD